MHLLIGWPMVKRLNINRYKKLNVIAIEFDCGVNAISGTNGTCKTTLLHMISNAYKAISRKDHQFKDPEALRMINSLNAQVNTKIEKLAKGDRQYNNPAPGYKEGSLFEVEYLDGSRLSFRKHNSAVNNRYAIKPYYKKGSHDRLPAKPVIYLGLARLIPWGEYQDDGALKNSSFILPEDAQSELSDLYARITGIHASSFQAQSLRDIKKRQEFSTDIEGVDSNTVSSGEENVLILLTALLSLKRYYEALDESSQSETVCSLLLVDELDATLHPSFQYALLQLLIEYSTLFHIQIVFTTHSIFMLKQMFKEKQNVIYLYDGAGVVSKMDNPDIEKIEMYLTNRSRADLFSEKKIPVFTEDEEARCLIRLLISHLCKQADGFNHLNRHIHLIDGNLGGDVISSLFKDSQLRQSAIASFAILDGDKPSNLSNNTIALPGDGSSPEWLLFDYAIKLSTDGNNPFWADECIQGEGFSISNFNQWIKPEIDEARNVVGGGQKREKAKAVFNRNILFFTYVFKAWMLDSANARDIRKFGFNLQAVYHKTANYHRIFIPSTVDFGIYTFKYE